MQHGVSCCSEISVENWTKALYAENRQWSSKRNLIAKQITSCGHHGKNNNSSYRVAVPTLSELLEHGLRLEKWGGTWVISWLLNLYILMERIAITSYSLLVKISKCFLCALQHPCTRTSAASLKGCIKQLRQLQRRYSSMSVDCTIVKEIMPKSWWVFHIATEQSGHKL